MKATIIFLGFIAIAKTTFAQDTTYNAVIEQLFRIDESDQLYRNQIDDVENKYGKGSEEIKALYKKMKEADSVNLVKVAAIIDQYGWLGYDVIGSQANSALFMVIQHSDLKTQEKYLPMVRAAVKNHKAKAGELALLEDRVALGEGKKQIYGSQISWNPKTNKYFILPLDDPDNVDKRRAAVGLQPLADYVSVWEIKWDAEQYKKDLPSIEEERKIK